MSSVLASYTTAASRSPVLPASSGVPARCSWGPSVAYRPSAAVKCGRRPLAVTCALPANERLAAFSIPPTALLCPVLPPDGKERWDIKEEAGRVTLWFQVPGLSEDDIEVNASDDMLEIKRRSSLAGTDQTPVDAHGVGAFHIRLLMTKEYDGDSVTAELKSGMLEVTVGKRPHGDREVRTVTLGPQGKGQGAGAARVSLKEEIPQGGGAKQGAGVEAGASGKGSSST
ncbi:heat shock protein 21, chloroplastic-like [Phragmites australis]|uniref:heat shock protein 21, chloroplastic-like n=1 Tax=Phragmites australis TaxID=29695 RepID=UPI002D78E664|nr:heat shock protein 21, chloroplastic-like [Phragmites australis]